MNFATWIVILLIILAVGLAIRILIRNKKQGRGCCGTGSTSCSSCSSCISRQNCEKR